MLYAPLDSRWLARWVAGSTIANLVGGSVAASLVAAAHSVGAGSSTLACLAIGACAGVTAGAIVGSIQSSMLPSTLSPRAWRSATIAGTTIVWTLVAIMPMLLAHGPAQPMIAHIALAMNVGAGAGMLFAAFQAPLVGVLAVRSRPWLLATSAGWGTAAAATYVITGAPTSTVSALVAAFVLAGTGGLASGAATALAFRLEARRAQLIGQSTGRTCATELV